jgi:hypothetical protein
VNVEWTGLLLSLTTVATIGFGHVMVRKVNYHFGTKPVPIVAAIGIAVLMSSMFASTTLVSGALGIVGITTLWDAIEFVRQEKRVLRGHAPRNPKRMT